MSIFVPDLSNEPALTMVRMHNDLTRQLLVIRVIMINTLNLGSAFLFLKKNLRFRGLSSSHGRDPPNNFDIPHNRRHYLYQLKSTCERHTTVGDPTSKFPFAIMSRKLEKELFNLKVSPVCPNIPFALPLTTKTNTSLFFWNTTSTIPPLTLFWVITSVHKQDSGA